MKKVINFDGILSFFLLAVTVWADYAIYITGAVPFKWRLSAIAIISIIALLCIVLTIKKMPNWAKWVRRVICLLLTIALGFGSLYITKVSNFTKNITDVKDATENISVVVKNDSSIKKITQLKNQKVGMNTLADNSNANYVKKKLDSKVKNIEYVKDNNYIDLANALLNDEIDALIISDSYINSASIEDSVPGFSAQLKKLKTYERKTGSADSLAGNSGLDLTKESFSVLISGMDDTGSPNHNSRSDVNMLVLVNPKTKMVQMISFPRDAYLPNPALNNGNDKLTHTGNDGVENTLAAIENVVGFDIDFYAKVNFTSLLEIVDTLGGVTVDVPYSFTEQNSERVLDTISVEKGEQVLDGEQALAFARHRYDGVGDVGRTKAQQLVLSAIIQKALKSSPTTLANLLDIAPKYMVTNITNSQLEHFIAYQLENMGHWVTLNYSLENGYNANLITASMGSVPLSCNVLNRSDVELVFQKYELIFNTKKLKDFKFDLSDMNKYLPDSSLSSKSNVIFSDQNFSKYEGQEEPDIDTTYQPEVPTVTPPAVDNNTGNSDDTGDDSGNTGGSGDSGNTGGDSGNTGGGTGGSGGSGSGGDSGNPGGSTTQPNP